MVSEAGVDGQLLAPLVAGHFDDLLGHRLPVVDAGNGRVGRDVADLDLHDLIVDHADRFDVDVDEDILDDLFVDRLVPRPIHIVERVGGRRRADGIPAERERRNATHQGVSVETHTFSPLSIC